MSAPLTHDEVRAEIARARATAKRLRLEALAQDAYADELAASLKVPLTIERQSDTVETQMHVESAGAKRAAGQFTDAQAKHPFVAMLIKRGTDVGVVAARLEELLHRKFPRSTVQAWYKDQQDPYFRAPPEDAVKALKAEYGVPLSAWPRVKAAK